VHRIQRGGKMKITRKNLRQLILKEFRNTYTDDNIDYLGSGSGPPTITPSSGGGGGPRKKPCDSGMPRAEASFTKVMNSYQPWMQANFDLGGNKDFMDHYFDHLEKLNIATEPDDPFNFLKWMMDVIATYYCVSRSFANPPSLQSIYNNPNNALKYYWGK
jgi:hypothetical protein